MTAPGNLAADAHGPEGSRPLPTMQLLQRCDVLNKLLHGFVLRGPAGAYAHGGVVLVGLAHVGHGVGLGQLVVPLVGQDKELLVRRGVVQHLAALCLKGGADAQGLVFDGVAEALRVPGTDIRLFGKPESFVKRRMGVALAHANDVETARTNAKLAASRVKPRVAG